MAYTVRIGSIRCHILSDGLHYVDGGGFFGLIPRVLWQEVVEADALNRIPCDSRCLLVESDAGLILVDVGNGDKLLPKLRQRMGMDSRSLRLVGELARVGYRPEDVDIVLFTHFHGDHIGGATRWDTRDGSPGPVVPVFPARATSATASSWPTPAFPTSGRPPPTSPTTSSRCWSADNWRSWMALCGWLPPYARTLHRAIRHQSRPCGWRTGARACSLRPTLQAGPFTWSGCRGCLPSTSFP